MGTLSIATGIPSEVAFNLSRRSRDGVRRPLRPRPPLSIATDGSPSRSSSSSAVGSLVARRGRDIYQAFQSQLDHSWCPGRVSVFSLILGNVHAFEMAAFNQIFLIFLLGFDFAGGGGLDLRGGGRSPSSLPSPSCRAAPPLWMLSSTHPGRDLSPRARSP